MLSPNINKNYIIYINCFYGLFTKPLEKNNICIMIDYIVKGDKFIIRDYLNAKKFSSFLPSIAGEDGKPLWAFYANVGQCLAGFGVDNKESPLTPFDSAFLAYNNISLKSFRTLIEINGKQFQPFTKPCGQELIISKSNIVIKEETDEYLIEITYSTISHRHYPGLIRKVKITNKREKRKFNVVDGLPIFLPKGVSNYEYHELTTLVAAYTEANLSNDSPWFKYNNRGGDDSKAVFKADGSGYFSVSSKDERLKYIVDPDVVFGDSSYISFNRYDKIISNKESQVTQNKILGAFSCINKELDCNETLEFISVFSVFNNEQEFNLISSKLSFAELDTMILETEQLIDSLLPEIKTSNSKLDEYLKQSFLDNGIRGGFPTFINGKTVYLYSRKHGDMERDYNAFYIPSTYFSSGLGNYRDINQNRRNDLLLEPKIDDYNIYLFMSLIEANGFNPLLVDTKVLDKDYLNYQDALDYLNNKNAYDINAEYKEGYWIDHWVYNIDLIENYLSVYPDRIDELLSKEIYRFYDSGIRIKPRRERYINTDNGIRQYNSLEKINVDSNWLRNKGIVVTVNLASKLFDLILKKVCTLDYRQMGLEMYADKPGWNDSCNGLPGLLASSMNESIELLRLIKLFKQILKKEVPINLLEASYRLFSSIKDLSIDGFSYWDKVNTCLEEFENDYRSLTNLINVGYEEVIQFLNKYESVLSIGIEKATKLNNGVTPTYIINEVDRFVIDNGIKVLSFKSKFLPNFLEAPARKAKLGILSIDEIKKIEQSDLFDKELQIFKTSESLNNVTKEIGRTTLFTQGWLERESDFLHMTFKYLLGLLKDGQYKQFFKYAKTNLPCFMDPNKYGRSVFENVSFIVPTNHPNKNLHGSGNYARLTGANTEIINMYQLIFFGEHIFQYDNGNLSLSFTPHIPLELFSNNELVVTLFKTKIVFHNVHKKDYDEQTSLFYSAEGIEQADLAKKLRNKELSRLDVYIN